MAEIRQHPGNIGWANLSGVGSQRIASIGRQGRQYVASRDQVLEVIQRFAELANVDTDQPDLNHLRHQRGEQANSSLPERLCRFIVGMVRK